MNEEFKEDVNYLIQNAMSEQQQITVPLVTKSGEVPAYKTAGAGAVDLSYYGNTIEKFTPHEAKLLPTGIFIKLPTGYVGLVFIRSGCGKVGFELSNGVGFVDEDYTGEIFIALRNATHNELSVEPGERIAQLCVIPVPKISFMRVQQLEQTNRGSSGFGSTGKF